MGHISHTIKEWDLTQLDEWTKKRSRQIAINMLKSMLEWSDRIGSDEKDEIQSIISILKNK